MRWDRFSLKTTLRRAQSLVQAAPRLDPSGEPLRSLRWIFHSAGWLRHPSKRSTCNGYVFSFVVVGTGPPCWFLDWVLFNLRLQMYILFADIEFSIAECRGLHQLSHAGEEISSEGGEGARPHLGVVGGEDLLHRWIHSALWGGQEDRGAGRGFEGEGDRSLPAIGESITYYHYCICQLVYIV